MRLCVFCGSSVGDDPRFSEAAKTVGRAIAQAGAGLVYGAGNLGLMGVVADEALAHGAEVHGVIPRALVEMEVAHHGLTELHVVETMHERKQLMHDLSDAFLTLPGGLGTLEELFEIWTWAQLDFHHKPLGILDVAGYYAPLREQLAQSVAHGFVRDSQAELASISDDPSEIVAELLRRAAAASGS